jgi:hypothetical protein
MRFMTRLFAIATTGLACAVGGATAQPRPAPPAAQPAQPAQPAPWANKFFLPDIATNRDQPAPPVVTHNFGDVPHGTLCAHKFTVTNIYDAPMQITDVRKSCSCLDYVPMTKVLQPNETAEFTVTMNTGKFVGHNAQTFYVTFGPKFVSVAALRVSATSRTDVSVNPGAVAFGQVPQGTRVAQTVSVKYTGRARDWKLTEAVPGGAPFDVRLTETSRGGPLRGGAEYAVEVALKADAPAGALSEQIALKTNDSANPVVTLNVTATVVAPLELSPNRVRLEAAVGETATYQVIVRAAKPFKVVGIDGAGDGLTVEAPATAAALPVQVLKVKFAPTKPGAVARQFRVRTDFAGDASATLSVEALGTK